MCIGRCVMACIGKAASSIIAPSNGGYQNGSGSKYVAIRAAMLLGRLTIAVTCCGQPERLHRLRIELEDQPRTNRRKTPWSRPIRGSRDWRA